MKTSITLVILSVTCIAITTAIPFAEEGKTLKDQVRSKRGWGYEYVHAAPVTTILGPSKTVITSPQVVHTAITAPTATHVVVPQRVATIATSAIAVPATHTESYVYHSAPDHSYYIHQRHPSGYQYYYPQTQYYYDPYYTASVPLQVVG